MEKKNEEYLFFSDLLNNMNLKNN